MDVVLTTNGLVGNKRISVRLEYRVSDPLAIHASFGGTEWMFARDLLDRGTREPVGEGDVTINSTAHLVGIGLRSPYGSGEVVVFRPFVVDFLSKTFDLVPAGAEVMPNWDEWTWHLPQDPKNPCTPDLD